MGLIDTVYNIGDKVDCSCSIWSPAGGKTWLFCCIDGFICCIDGSWKGLNPLSTPLGGVVGGRPRHASSIPSETSIFPIIWSTIACISTAAIISSGVKSMIGIPIKSLIAATIVKTMLAIWSSTIGVNAASKLAKRSGVLILPAKSMAAHI